MSNKVKLLIAIGMIYFLLGQAACESGHQDSLLTAAEESAARIGSGASSTTEVTRLTLNPTVYDFEVVPLYRESSAVISILNSGNTLVSIDSLSITGHRSYSLTHNCPDRIKVEESCAATVTFFPTSNENVSAIVNVEYNGSSNRVIGIIGQGESNLLFNGISSITNIGATTAQLNWNAVTGGIISAYLVQQKVNEFWQTIDSISNSSTSYYFTSLTPNTSYEWRVLVVDIFGLLIVNDNSAEATTLSVGFDALDSNFLEMTEDSATEIDLTCVDTRGSDALFSILSISDPDLVCSISGPTLSCRPENKTGNSNWKATISLRCTINGQNLERTESISVINRDITEVTLLAFNPSAYDFGAVTLSSTATQDIIMTNAGNTEVTLGSIALTGPSSFSLSENCDSTLGVSAQCTIQVSFTPSSSNSVSALLLVSYNNGGQKAISLIGRGGSSLVFNGIDSVTNVGASSARLNWSTATGGSVSSYLVYQLSNSSWEVIATLPNTSTNYTIIGLTPATIYQWKIFALDAFGVPDGNSIIKSASTLVIAFDAIDPQYLSVDEESETVMTLNCSDSAGNNPTYSLVSLSDNDAGCSLDGDTLTCVPNNKDGHDDWTADINLRCNIDGSVIDRTETLNIGDYSRPPILTVPADRSFPNHLHVGSNIILNSTATDQDNDTITYACTVRSTNLSPSSPYYSAPGAQCDDLVGMQGKTAVFDESSGTLTWTPGITQIATYVFTITADDGYGGSDLDSFSITVAEPFSQAPAPEFLLDSRFVDSSGNNGINSQTTTWTDLSGNEVGVTIEGTSDNASDHWNGAGTYIDPYRLTLDGTNDYVSIDYTNITGSYTYIYFRIPSSASDGTHVIASFREALGVAYIKGAGENRLYYTSYNDSTYSGYTAVNSIPTDTWLKMYVWNEGGISTTSNGRRRIYIGPIDSQITGMNDTRITPQLGVGTHGVYLGYKPSVLGPASGPLAAGTAQYGNIEVVYLMTYTSSTPGGNWQAQEEYFMRERFRATPLGDTRLPSMSYVFDAASGSFTGYSANSEGSNCNETRVFMVPVGTVENQSYERLSSASLMNVNNTACLSDLTGWRGSGNASNPYRVAFDGSNDRIFMSTSMYSTQFVYSIDTLENSFDIWFRAGASGNAASANGFGPAIYMTQDSNLLTSQTALALKNNGDGTSNLQLQFHSPSEVINITDTSVTVNNDAWTHVAVVVTGSGEIRLYKNGALAYTGSTPLTANPFMPDTTCNSGGRRCSRHHFGGVDASKVVNADESFEDLYFRGEIALFRSYYAHALSADEVLYNCTHGMSRFSGASCSP